MAEEGFDALLVSSLPNIRYLTGFTGSAGVLLLGAEGDDLFVTDGRYDRQARHEVAEDVEVVITTDPALVAARSLLVERGAESVGCEGDHLSVSAWQQWVEESGPALTAVSGWVESLRVVKSSAEVDAIRRAARVVDAAFEELVAWLRPGVTEREAAARLDLILAECGAEGRAFETIVAFGERSALPHARPGARDLREGDVVLLDFGGVVDGYCSDMTRTVACGDVGEVIDEVYRVVLEAQCEALEKMRAGQSGREADALARDVIEAAGYGDHFAHSLGHGIGLVVHEEPRISKKNEDPLPVGAVVTVEPGVYLEGVGGVRIEDDVVIGERGNEILTGSPKDTWIPVV